MRGVVCFQDVRNQDLQGVPITFCVSVRTLQLGRKKDALIDPLHFWLNSKANNRRIVNAIHFFILHLQKRKIFLTTLIKTWHSFASTVYPYSTRFLRQMNKSERNCLDCSTVPTFDDLLLSYSTH